MKEKLLIINRSLSDYTKLTPMNMGETLVELSYRYNNVTVDGGPFNNSFGLSSSLKATELSQLVFEAIDQDSSTIALYDVRNVRVANVELELTLLMR